MRISAEDTILGMIILSANDASIVMAEALGGSEWQFAKQMTLTARRLGMNNTIYKNASGLPDEEQITTAYDLAKFVREGNTRGLFQGREVVSMLTGEPEYLDPLKDETPNGWIVTGYPWYGIQTPEHKAFYLAYHRKFNDYPRLGSVVGYSAIKSLATGITKAKSTETEKLITAFRGLTLMTPFGKAVYRPQDHQSTMGAFVGRTKNDKGRGTMVDYVYFDGAKFQPTDAEVKKLRPAD